jgi:hypothetical protein
MMLQTSTLQISIPCISLQKGGNFPSGTSYFSPTALLTAGLFPIISTHSNKHGNFDISSTEKPENFHPLTHGQAFISAILYLLFPEPTRYSRGLSPTLTELERRISSTLKTRSAWLREFSMANGIFSFALK